MTTIMKNRTSLIVTTMIIIIAVLFMYLWISGIFATGVTTLDKPSVNITPELKDTNSSPIKLPSELRNELRTLEWKYSIGFSKWNYDPIENEIILYDYPTFNENVVKNLQGKQIGNFTIRIQHDTEFETTRVKVREQLWQLHTNPDYQLARISMITDPFGDPPGNYAELWVYNSTPENKKLDNTVIQGWTILVYPMAPLPADTVNNSKSR